MEYRVFKIIDGQEYYEGQGPMDYVNRISEHFVKNGILFKITEARSKNSIVLNILNTCLELKKYGIDAFFEYQPHVNYVFVEIYMDGWEAEAKPDYRYNFMKAEVTHLKKLESDLVRILWEVKK